jgi:DNA-binding NarL/FixJ family response regulator
MILRCHRVIPGPTDGALALMDLLVWFGCHSQTAFLKLACIILQFGKLYFYTPLAACQNGPDQAQRSQARIARRAQAVKPLVEPLSERELEVLQLIAIGKKNQEIADDLVISLNTVRYHTKNLYGKLGVNKRTQAVAKAQKLGLI